MLLKIGSSGEGVRTLQSQLDTIGVPCKADGLFGPKTKRAVETFQTASGISVTGELDDEGRAKLDELLAMVVVPPVSPEPAPPTPIARPAPPAVAPPAVDGPPADLPAVSEAVLRPPSGALGLNRSMPVGHQAPQLAALGYRFAIRFVNLAGRRDLPEITAGEVHQIRAAGIALGLTQMFRTSGITPEQGRADGIYLAEAALSLGFPANAGVVLWWDLETTPANKGQFRGMGNEPVTRDVMMSFLDNWASAVSQGGFAAGLYCGPQNHLRSGDLSLLTRFTSFWKAGTHVFGPEQGYQLVQKPGEKHLLGININENVVTQDERGELPAFWAGRQDEAS